MSDLFKNKCGMIGILERFRDFAEGKKKLIGEFLRFCIVGGVCTIIDYVVFLIVSNMVAYQFAVVMGFIVSFVVNYSLTALWTFHVKPTKYKFVAMIACHLVNLIVVRIGVLMLLVDGLEINKDFAYLPVLFISALTSFFMMRFVFCQASRGMLNRISREVI